MTNIYYLSKLVIFGIYISLTVGLSVIVTVGFILTQTPVIRVLFNLEDSLRKQIILGVFFGSVSILGTYLGTDVNGAIANIRDVGAISGGLFGGPFVGLIAGLIGGVHRFSLGGFTAAPCALATILNGTIAGILYTTKRGKVFPFLPGAIFTAIAEVVHMGLVLFMSRPFPEALSLVKTISGPMILANPFGVALFLLVIQVSMREREKVSAITAEKVLKIAEKTLPILSRGLSEDTADAAVHIILKNTNLDAVAITDTDKILAFSGTGEDHHKVGFPFRTSSTMEAIKTGKTMLLRNEKEVGCNFKNCPISSGIVVPLKTTDEEVFGTLKLYRVERNAVTLLDEELAKGLAAILVTQIELNEIEKEKELRTRSQLKALQARINPHFLFNTLNTIGYIVRKDPEKGRNLIHHLSFILRETLDRKSNFVELSDEIRLVRSYLRIEKERFGDKLTTEFNITPEALKIKIPSLIVQPIVENAVKHGFSSSVKKLKITVSAYTRLNMLYIVIKDTGKGISKDKIDEIIQYGAGESIGIRNVLDRMKNLYGNNYQFKIRSSPGKGTKVIIGIPVEGVKKWLFEQLSLTTKSPQGKK